MTRLDSPLQYIRRLHEQLTGHKAIYCELTNPKINHFHQNRSQEKTDSIGKMCAYLHSIDEMKASYPKHHKEDMYYELYKKEGLD